MTGQIALDSATSDKIQEEANAFMGRLRELMGPSMPEPPMEAASFVSSVGVQAVTRGLFDIEKADLNQSILIGAGEGLGMLLGLIEDPYGRMAMFQHCVQAMHLGLQRQSAIHTPAGEA